MIADNFIFSGCRRCSSLRAQPTYDGYYNALSYLTARWTNSKVIAYMVVFKADWLYRATSRDPNRADLAFSKLQAVMVAAKNSLYGFLI
ncbi:hypothetical protein TNCV_2851541 [Trichonephila clavipes]|nr:hypothetical protein TNCV_2851541 [Trichonephila clavipes]